MIEVVPSRASENYRFTQLAIPPGPWSNEMLTTGQDTNSPAANQTLAPDPWTDDFYLSGLRGLAASELKNFTEGEWKIIRSTSTLPQVRGNLHATVASGQQVKIFEVIENQSDFNLLVRNIKVEAGGKLEYFIFQRQIETAKFILRHFFDLAENARVDFKFFHLGGQKGQHRISARVAENADFRVHGATRLDRSQHVDIWAESEHVGANSRSETSVSNVLSGEAVAVFNGMIRILTDCPKTEAYQSNKTLLLSDSARVYTLPKLEIATDDVKCSHGASVSSLDPDQLFYLQSRGIGPTEAREMLVEAFTHPVIKFLPQQFLTADEKLLLDLEGAAGAF